MRLLKNIIIQLKIVARYSDLFIAQGMFYSGLLMIFVSLYDFKTILDIPLLIVVIGCVGAGPFLGEIFWGGVQEKMNYCIIPSRLYTILLSKSIALIIVMFLTPIPVLIGSSLFFDINFHEYINAGLYLITSIPIFLIIGNIVSAWYPVWQPANSSRILFFQTLMVIISGIPYLIFKVWLESIFLCLVFGVLFASLWYYCVLPLMAKIFRLHHL